METKPIPSGPVDRLVGRHTPGPWQVIARDLPHYMGTHEVRTIYTAWDHPQMQGPLPVVCVATGIGESRGGPAVQFCSISASNAALIAAAPELLDALLKLMESAETSDDACYGTLSTTFVRSICEPAIAKALGVQPNTALTGAPRDGGNKNEA